ncbi:MAG: hypothetical protein N5P05_001816 [Chroococcopsis gigantea SAG 12.99]|jgi:putative spermidine/putrescine transport system substrate-binding protein|nr:hypothetical protein [Chroococcopsis gigantea SAG 12.99]
MTSRRFFLRGISALTLGQILTACGEQSAAFRVLLLQGSIPTQLLASFRRASQEQKGLVFKSEETLKSLFKLLETWQKQKSSEAKKSSFSLPFIKKETNQVPNLTTLGDAWLGKAIEGNAVQPLDPKNWTNWSKLPPKWQELVKRDGQGDRDNSGEIWGAPYRWGTTMIAYEKEKFKQLGISLEDWSDLWREELRNRLSVVDNSREIIGLTLKKMGYSYNETDLDKIGDLKNGLIKFNGQVKFYSSSHYLEPLILGDTWAAVGWSSDILPLLQSRGNTIGAIVPRSGTALWSDLWVKPTNAPDSPVTDQWIDFCWQNPGITQIALFADGLSPIPLDSSISGRNNPLLNMSPQTLEGSEFLYPLSPATQQQYDRLWAEMRVR